jgi:hypothetical protein
MAQGSGLIFKGFQNSLIVAPAGFLMGETFCVSHQKRNPACFLSIS